MTEQSPTLAQKLFYSRTASFLCTFCISFGFILWRRTYAFSPLDNHFSFGWEMGRVAASLVSGNGYSSPLPLPAGPTALVLPLYPLFMAFVFKLFGIYSTKSAIVLLFFNCVFSGLTAIVIRQLGALLVNDFIGAAAGWVWAIYPYGVYVNSHRVWETSLSTVLIATLLLVAYRLRDTSRAAAWLGFGALCGGATLAGAASSLLTVLILWGWIAWRWWRQGWAWLKPMTVTVLVFAVMMCPWWIRNYKVFGKFIPLRTGFWLEVWIGNCFDGVIPGHGQPQDYFAGVEYNQPGYWIKDKLVAESEHPSAQIKQCKEYARVGELAYMEEKRAETLQCLKTHPEQFLALMARRIIYTWTAAFYLDISDRFLFQTAWVVFYTTISILAFAGLFLLWKIDVVKAVPLALLLLLYPAAYYLTHNLLRFRYPIDPEILLLAMTAAYFGYRRLLHPQGRNLREDVATLEMAG